jgi:hypothetical protein
MQSVVTHHFLRTDVGRPSKRRSIIKYLYLNMQKEDELMTAKNHYFLFLFLFFKIIIQYRTHGSSNKLT